MIQRKIRDLDYIKDRIEFYTGLDVREDTRKREYVYARVIFVKIMREEFFMTFQDIGVYLGRAHCSIMYILKKFEEIEMYEKNYLKVYHYILLEMESEQLFIGNKHIGEKQDIDKEVLKVREAIHEAVGKLQIA